MLKISRRPTTGVCPQLSCAWSSWERLFRTNRDRYFHRRWHEENIRKHTVLYLAGYSSQLESGTLAKMPAPTLVSFVLAGRARGECRRTGLETSPSIRTRRPRAASIARAVVPARTELSRSIGRSPAISCLLAEDANAVCAPSDGTEVRA